MNAKSEPVSEPAALDLAAIRAWAVDLFEAFTKDEADWALNLVIAVEELDHRSPVTTILALVDELERCRAERDALREALGEVLRLVTAGEVEDDTEAVSLIENAATAALGEVTQ